MIVPTERGDIGLLDVGAGPAVVLLHPLAMAGELWRPLIEATPGFRFLAVDARGHGEAPWDGKPFTMQDLAADVAALIETLRVARVGVAGMSMGGMTATILAATRPDLIGSLALLDTTACYGPDRVEAWAGRATKAATTPRADQLPFQLDRWFSPSTVESAPETVEHACGVFLRTDSEAHAAACRAMGEVDATPLLGSVTAPTLVLVGADDYATPKPMAEQLHAGIAGSRLEVVVGVRHLSAFDDPRPWSLVTEHLRSTLTSPDGRDGTQPTDRG